MYHINHTSIMRRIISHTIFSVVMAICGFIQVSATTPLEARNDSLVNSHKFIFFGEGDNPHADSVRRLIMDFYVDQFRHFQDPEAPYFLFMSKDASLAMGIGGVVRLRSWTDWGGSVNSTAFAPYLIPIPKDPVHDKDFGTTPAGTSLFFRVIGRNRKLGNYQLYIQAQFSGYAHEDFKLKKAYAQINDWTVGLATSTFSDAAAEPPTVDANGSNVSMDQSAVLVRWMHVWKNRWRVAASLETPAMSIDTDGVNTAARSQFLPNVAALVQYQWGYNQHVQLAGIMRSLPYRDLLTEKNYNTIGWGVQLSTVLNIAGSLTFYGITTYGKGYASYSGDMLMGNYDMVPDPELPGRLYAPRAVTFMSGLQYHFNPMLFVSATFGQSRYLPGKAVDPTEYKYGQFYCANVIWNLTPRISMGAEFDLGKRQNFNGDHRWARRFSAMAQFSF